MPRLLLAIGFAFEFTQSLLSICLGKPSGGGDHVRLMVAAALSTKLMLLTAASKVAPKATPWSLQRQHRDGMISWLQLASHAKRRMAA